MISIRIESICIESQQERNLDNLSRTVPANAEQMLGADDTLQKALGAHLQKGSE